MNLAFQAIPSDKITVIPNNNVPNTLYHFESFSSTAPASRRIAHIAVITNDILQPIAAGLEPFKPALAKNAQLAAAKKNTIKTILNTIGSPKTPPWGPDPNNHPFGVAKAIKNPTAASN